MLFRESHKMTKLTQLKLFTGGFFASLFLVMSLAFIPVQQDAGLQATVFNAVTVNATPQAVTVACNQGTGQVGRKTLVVHNGSGGAVTVTAELRDDQLNPNFTSGYLAVNNLAAASASSDTSTPSEAGGRFCRVTAVSASSSVITVTLRRE